MRVYSTAIKKYFINKMQNMNCILLSNVDDLCFLYPSLEQIHDIFNEIIIMMGEQRWTGEYEDITQIDELRTFISSKKEYSHIRVITYNVNNDMIKCMQRSVVPAMYWEAHARWIAYNDLKLKDGYIVILDADEIIEGIKFKQWLDTHEYEKYDAMKLSNYWYWRKPIYRAKNYIEDSVVMLNMKKCNPIYLFSNMGRHGIYESIVGNKKRNITFNDEPFIHHYSWVRNKDQMLRKVKSWGHRNDKDSWEILVEQEFQKKEIEKQEEISDFVKGLSYNIVTNIFDIYI